MCGRKFSDESLSWSMYREQLKLFTAPPASNFAPNYNIAPTHMVPVCFMEDGEKVLRPLRWGLLPSWAKDVKIGYSMINAKAETVEEKNSFAPLLKAHRCVIPVSGFFEWKRKGKSKQPFAIRRQNGEPILLAGLWTQNRMLGIDSYTVLTTQPNDLMAEIHNRMPVILEREDVDRWLDAAWDEAQGLAIRVQSDFLRTYTVSSDVGNVRNNSPDLIEPVL
ncbi:SOS response-associated peptidase [Parvularcula flava]|uniref:Abasic site processing protein n=1 Tax=Aquisalinus luteolus TaxID=1566827 RepID=A0A8J3A273_9PROT|nr:SOS response-associated peptidase [Aquisalinus luteolus]NHK27188.1 SOS response-associated peptidase [Aquisalinus luteolus]GGH94675.1 DUF159 family protein [Aquisalinus luteolus]